MSANSPSSETVYAVASPQGRANFDTRKPNASVCVENDDNKVGATPWDCLFRAKGTSLDITEEVGLPYASCKRVQRFLVSRKTRLPEQWGSKVAEKGKGSAGHKGSKGNAMIRKWGLALVVIAVAWGAQAADVNYPARPIRFVCPYSPGGGGDVFARAIARKLAEYLGQSVVVDNRAGSNGGIGTEIVARAAPDGYTLLMGNSGPLTVNPSLYGKVPYDPLRDFAPISQGAVYMYVLIALPSLPVKNFEDFIGLLKAKHGELTYGSTGVGGGSHLAGELFSLMTHTRAIHVPYAGSTAALASLLGSRRTYMFATVVTSVPQVRAGKVRALGVTALKRSEALPDVPTLDEMGLKGYEITQWLAVLAPAGTPKPIIGKLHQAVVRALHSRYVIERIGPSVGNELVGNTAAEFAQVMKRDLAMYAKLVREARVYPQ